MEEARQHPVVTAAALCALALSSVEARADTAADPAEVEVPSGQPVSLLEVIRDTGVEGLVYRFRFVAPQIGDDEQPIDFTLAEGDMAWLCEKFAVPRLPTMGPMPAQVIISLSDRAVPFGEPAPDVVQFFEAYRLEDDACIWEVF